MGNDIVPHNTTELSVSKLSAVAALAGGSSVIEAASRAGVDRTTVHRWLSEDAAFIALVNRTKQEALDAIRAELRAGAAEAVRTIREIIAEPNCPPSARLRAALALLDAVGASTPEPIGPTEPHEIQAACARREMSRSMHQLISGLGSRSDSQD